jgi:hypothetical protein
MHCLSLKFSSDSTSLTFEGISDKMLRKIFLNISILKQLSNGALKIEKIHECMESI